MFTLKFCKILLYLLVMSSYIEITQTNTATQTYYKQVSTLEENESSENIKVMLAEDIVKNSTKEVCIRLQPPNGFDVCFKKPFPKVTNRTRDLLLVCSSKNYLSLKEFINGTHYLDSIDVVVLAKCFDIFFDTMSVKDSMDIINMLALHLDLYSPKLSKRLLFKFVSQMKRSDSIDAVVDSDYIFKVWNPFSTNVSGILLYKDLQYIRLYQNESIDKINKTNFELAIYIPFHFLNDANRYLTVKEKEDFQAIILLILNKRFSNKILGHENVFLGLYITGICGYNDADLVGFMTENFDQKKEFKLSDFDTEECAGFSCEAHEILFLNLDKASSNLSCPIIPAGDNRSAIIWPQIPKLTPGRYYYPENICADNYFRIPTALCDYTGTQYWGVSNETICFEGLTSNSKEIYQLVKCCINNGLLCPFNKINTSTAHDFMDVQLLMQMSDQTFENKAELVDKGLEFLKHEIPKSCFNVYECMFSIFSRFMDSIIHQSSIKNFQQNNFIFTAGTFYTSSVRCYVLRKNEEPGETGSVHNINHLTITNVDDKYLRRNNIEAYVQIKNISLDPFLWIFVGFILPSSDLTRNMPFICKTRMIALLLRSSSLDFVQYSFFLKIVDKNSDIFGNDEYWVNVATETNYLTLICITEAKDNVCVGNQVVVVYEKYYTADIKYDTGTLNRYSVRLSDLPEARATFESEFKRSYRKYVHVSTIITYIGCGLSLIGILFVLLSAVCIKGWFMKRLNTAQLFMVFFLQISVVFIRNTRINYLVHLVHVYSILAQFSWMLLIGYHQYQKFIKVFDLQLVGVTKSLIFGWLLPGLVVLIPLIRHNCFQCDLCFKNRDIYDRFLIIPIYCVIIINFIVYIIAMRNISKTQGPDATAQMKRTKIRFAILFIFFMGFPWVCMLITQFRVSVLSAWMYFSHVLRIILYFQGFILFILIIFFDKETQAQWRTKWVMLLTKKRTNLENKVV